MSCSIWPMARRLACLLFVGFLVVLALQQGVTNIQTPGAGTATVDPDPSSSSSSSSAAPQHLEQNSQVAPQPQLKGRTMGPKSSDDMVGDIKRKVPNGPDPIHNRRAGKSGEPPGRQ